MSDTIENIKSAMQDSGIDTATIEKVMDKFVVSDKNTVLRSNYNNVLKITTLMTIAEEWKKKGLKKSSRTLKYFIRRFTENMVSKDGNSWKYIFDAISAREKSKISSPINKLIGLDGKDK